MIVSKKPVRTIGQQVTSEGFSSPSLYSVDGLITFGSESNANFVDVVSVGPITSIDKIYVNDTDIETGEFPLSEFCPHTGDTETTPFEGNFTYVERAYSINKQAELTEGDDDTSTKTTFKRSVSGVGVSGVRISFTAPQFTHKDNKNRRKRAQAIFKLHLLDESGSRIKTDTLDTPYFYSSDPVSVQLTVMARPQDLNRVWEYEVEMDILNNYYRTVVTGNWTASIATELYKDTQTYKDVAMVSGKIVSSDVSGSTPKREYLVKGYKVDVPVYVGDTQTFLGEFKKETSSSHAWNAMAVMVDEKWGAGLPLDKMNISDFVEFDKYVSEILPDGSQRYKHSQELLKADNYFRIASQIVGAADGKLYEDTSGRVGVLIDRQTDKRRVVTSYDIKNEKVKRTTVPDKKRTNYVEIEFSDETNNYQKNIISVQDDEAIVINGLISEKLKSDTCTNPLEALRTIKKVMTNSQIAATTYVFTLGHTHEDIKIGEVLSIYDRIHSRVNYCGKTAAGSSSTEILVDKRTPIDLNGINNPYIVFDNKRDQPTKIAISNWSTYSITLQTPINIVPESFTSFGVESGDVSGIKPTLARVMGVTDNSGELQIECIEYNDSLQSYVENGTDLVKYKTQILPEKSDQLNITGLNITSIVGGLLSTWGIVSGNVSYVYSWRKEENDGTFTTINSGVIENTESSLNVPLDPVRYKFSVYSFDNDTGSIGEVSEEIFTPNFDTGTPSSLLQPSQLGVVVDGQRLSTYTGRSFTIGWDQDDSGGILQGFVLTLSQDGKTSQIMLDKSSRSFTFEESDLEFVFQDYDRTFEVSIYAYDSSLRTTSLVQTTITNPPIPVPTYSVSGDGVLTLLSSASALPEDFMQAEAYIWIDPVFPSTRPDQLAPAVVSTDPYKLYITENVANFNDVRYNLEVSLVDTFGRKGALSTTNGSVTLSETVVVPEEPELLSITGIDTTTVRINFSQNNKNFDLLELEFKEFESSSWITVSDLYDVTEEYLPPVFKYDPVTERGFVNINGLGIDKIYDIRARSIRSVTTSEGQELYRSEYSNVITGTVLSSIDLVDVYDRIDGVEVDLDGFLTNLDDVYDRIDGVGGELDDFLTDFGDPRDYLTNGVLDVFTDLDMSKAIIKETLLREEENRTIVGSLTQFRADYEEESTALYQELITSIAASDEATAEKVTILQASIDDNVAGIYRVDQAVADETSARATAIQTVTASIEDEVSSRTAEVNRVDQAIVDETSARASAISQVQANIDDETSSRTAEINRVDQAIVDETSARASAIQTVTANINDEISNRTAEISRVDQAIVDETSARATSISQVQANINDEVSDRTAEINRVDQAIVDETSARTTAVSQVQANINDEISDRTAEISRVDQAIVDEASTRATAIQTVTASINDEVSDRTAEISRVDQSVVDESSARATAVAEVQASIDDEVSSRSSEISRVDQAIVDESSARASAISQVQANIDDEVSNRTSEISRVDQAIVDESSARATAVSQVQANINDEVSDRTAEIARVDQALVTETSARATADSALSATISDLDDEVADVATVADSAVAAIGYCTMGGIPSGQNTESSCSLAGGTWVRSPLASAVKNVQVSSGGQTATIQQHYTAYKDLEGDLIGKAVLGVNTSGKFTGINIVGSSNSYSKLTFTADVFELENSSGVAALYYDSSVNDWKFNGSGTFSGNLSAAGGTFNGNLSAAGGTFSGDLVAAGGTFNGNLSAPTVTGGTFNGGNFIGNVFTGGQFVTASGTAPRIDLNDDGTYLIWAGSGSKVDSNAIFFIKKDGTGFVKGSFFSGQIIESKSGSGTVSASITHNSAGKDVDLALSSRGSAFSITSNSPPEGVGSHTYRISFEIKRGSTTLDSGSIIVNREVVYENGDYLINDYYSFTTNYLDLNTLSSSYTYSIVVGNMGLSGSSQTTTIRSFENILS